MVKVLLSKTKTFIEHLQNAIPDLQTFVTYETINQDKGKDKDKDKDKDKPRTCEIEIKLF